MISLLFKSPDGTKDYVVDEEQKVEAEKGPANPFVKLPLVENHDTGSSKHGHGKDDDRG